MFPDCCWGLQMYGLIWLTDLRSKLSKLDLLTMLASALCHDLDHPGYNNVYQVNTAAILTRVCHIIRVFVCCLSLCIF